MLWKVKDAVITAELMTVLAAPEHKGPSALLSGPWSPSRKAGLPTCCWGREAGLPTCSREEAGLADWAAPACVFPALLFWDTRVAGVSEQQAECSLIVFLRFKFVFFWQV